MNAKLTYMPELDGLRAIAVGAVLFAHIPVKYHVSLPFGSAGVQLFFVLSGFLITSILLRSKDVSLHKALKNFYADLSANFSPVLPRARPLRTDGVDELAGRPPLACVLLEQRLHQPTRSVAQRRRALVVVERGRAILPRVALGGPVDVQTHPRPHHPRRHGHQCGLAPRPALGVCRRQSERPALFQPRCLGPWKLVGVCWC